MDIALKKIELIEWLARLQDESSIQKIEALKKGLINNSYESTMPKSMEELQKKLIRSEQDQKEGRIHSQKEVEGIFKARFDQ